MLIVMTEEMVVEGMRKEVTASGATAEVTCVRIGDSGSES